MDLSFLLHLWRSWFRSPVPQRGILATQVWSGCSLFLALKQRCVAPNSAGCLHQRGANSLLTSEKQDLFLTPLGLFLHFIQCLLNINTKPVSELPSPVFQAGTLDRHPQTHTFRSNSIWYVSSVEIHSFRKKSVEVSSTLVCTAPLRSGRCGLKPGFP